MKSNKYLIKFDKDYKFEEETYKEIDLSGLENLKAIDLIDCQSKFARKGNIDALLETNLEYCLLIASKVSNKPIEFFYGLPAKYATTLKSKVSAFLLGAV